MAYVIIGLFTSLVSGWIWAEYNIKNPSTRLALGGAAILMLCASLFTSAQNNFNHDAHNSAAIRLLGEALDDGDIESARNAIHVYNTQTPRQTGHIIVSVLGDRKRNKSQ